MTSDFIVPGLKLRFGGQFAMNKQIRYLQEGGVLS
jgi:hypothetical protein